MIKKSFKYIDYLGEEREEDAWFNLNAAELTELNAMFDSGLQETAAKAKGSRDSATIIDIFKAVLKKSYGLLSPDGRRLMKKNGELVEEFMETPAYVMFFEEVVTKEGAFDRFLKGILPSDEEMKRYENALARAKEAQANKA